MLSSPSECKRSRSPKARRFSPLQRDPTNETGKLRARRVCRFIVKKTSPNSVGDLAELERHE
jgi:hypothetical protein